MDVKNVAIDAAKKAGSLLRDNFGRIILVEYKGEIDIVTEMDRQSEDIIIKTIQGSFHDHGILTEESKEQYSQSGFRWIIDPLDGTTNYAHSLPVFCVSIAFEDHGEVTVGVVYDPMLDELFEAEKGKGAFLNGRPIKVSKANDFSKSLLSTGFPYDIRRSKNNNLNHFSNFAVKAQAIRRMGSAAIDLAYLACGRFDGFWELKLHVWDVAAAALIIQEAGGNITDFNGGEYSMYKDNILASNGLIHEEMIQVLRNSSQGTVVRVQDEN